MWELSTDDSSGSLVSCEIEKRNVLYVALYQNRDGSLKLSQLINERMVL
jgi:hypothetical protein